jgi:arabinan endo-1,5-alpha-L-arabinosidase
MRGKTIALIVAFVCALTPAAHALGGQPTCSGATCQFPSPNDCATGDSDGVWNGGTPTGRGAVCAGAAGHDIFYVGGEPTATCGTVIVADVNVIDGPSAGRGSDPNDCPYAGWATEVHDPSVAREQGTYYVFGTGPGIPILSSVNRVDWHPAGRVFAADLPSWATATIPGTQIPWAPDISYFDGAWHVYYAISTFGAKKSAIGFATSPTLSNPRWTDHGVVVQSDETTLYNAIDPNVVIQPDGAVSLVFGSFNAGIESVALDPHTGLVASGAQMTTIASRLVPTWGIEASFVIQRGGYFYLFVSFDNCCRGADSTYNIRVGRATSLAGPFVDDAGVPMLLGGGRIVLQGEGTRRGPGHNAVLNDGHVWRLFFHYYDASANGTAKLGILPITWTPDGWPTVSWSRLRPTTID